MKLIGKYLNDDEPKVALRINIEMPCGYIRQSGYDIATRQIWCMPDCNVDYEFEDVLQVTGSYDYIVMLYASLFDGLFNGRSYCESLFL